LEGPDVVMAQLQKSDAPGSRTTRLVAAAGVTFTVACAPGFVQPTTQQASSSSHLETSVAERPTNVGQLRGSSQAHAGTSSGLATQVLAAGVLLGAASAARSAGRRRGVTRAVAVHEHDFTSTDTTTDIGLGAEGDDEEEMFAPIVDDNVCMTRRNAAQGVGVAAVGAAVAAEIVEQPAEAKEEAKEGEKVDNQWVQYDLNSGETLYDVDFDTEDTNHGFVVGAHGLFYESRDGGRRWVSRSFQNLSKGSDESQYRFQNVSVKGNEVWIIGKPPLLLHSKNAGKSWKKVPLSKKLPGEPKVIFALGLGEDGKGGKAELATSSGAVYITDNDGRNWSAQVKETVDATLNRVSSSGVSGASYFTGSVKSIRRDASGAYLAVAQRGNFYLTFTPGQPRWVPHNRVSARRIQAMGFRAPEYDGGAAGDVIGAWMSLNGGLLANSYDEKFVEAGTESKDLFTDAKIKSGGIGIIDIAYRTDKEAWAVGGSGVIYVTQDGGKNWTFDVTGDELPCNLYNVKIFNKGTVGYMIGSNGILLRKQFPPVPAKAPKAAPKEAAEKKA